MKPNTTHRERNRSPLTLVGLAVGVVCAVVVSGVAEAGTKIAFSSGRDSNSPSYNEEIYVMNADGTNQTRLTNHVAYDCCPSWSPDGSQIAFTSWSRESFPAEIYVMNADGTNQTNITNHVSTHDQNPSWSPDGTQIAFVSDRDGSDFFYFDIYVMNADGTNQTSLTNSDSFITGIGSPSPSPSWSPDGSQIAFASILIPSSHISLDLT